jgi:outer membrane protein OmpA-like peptidoglycan-associated protein
MPAAATAEAKAKKKAKVSSEPAAPVSDPEATVAQGAPAGMPLFLEANLRRKLAVGAADDPLEREADDIAEHVIHSSAEGTAPASPRLQSSRIPSAPLQRKCACGGNASGPCEECQKREEQSGGTAVIHRQAKPGGNSDRGAEAPPIVHQALSSPGLPLETPVRSRMERGFQHDFGDVRIHTGPLAAQSAQAVHAHAYTTGNSVVFAEGRYAPQSDPGQRLLAHELAHVVQQRGGSGHTSTGSVVSSQSSPKLQRFGSTEHEELGNTTGVSNIDLGGGVVLTWGQVLALAGDYYGSLADLQADTASPDGRARIRAAMTRAGLPSVASSTLPVPSPADDRAILTQYLQLVVHNIPHFLGGGTSRETWLDHHTRAIDSAIREGLSGAPLNNGFLLEAFGQHFYTDSFSGGHIRTPRKDISDWYRIVFGPRVVNHFIDTLRARAESEIYSQVMGSVGVAVEFLTPNIGTAVRLFIHHAVGTRLDTAIAGIGGRAAMVDWFGLIVGGMVSGTIHDLEGDRGVVVRSRAHPAPWTAYGDGLLDDPRNADSRAEAVAGVAEAKADIDLAYLIALGEHTRKSTVPLPTALPSVVYFGFDDSSLSPTATTDMAGALSYMTYNPEVEVDVVGYTDPIGKPGYNIDLGGRRAEKAASVMIAGGIAPARVHTSSAGETGLVTTNPAQYWRDRRVTLNWRSVPSGSAITRDVAYERAAAAVAARIPPPYKAEQRLPEPVAGANPAIPEWHWGKLDRTFQAQIGTWISHQLTPYIGMVTSSPALAPIVVPIAGSTSVTVDPRPIVTGIVHDLLADPIAFLNAGFGEDAGP